MKVESFKLFEHATDVDSLGKAACVHTKPHYQTSSSQTSKGFNVSTPSISSRDNYRIRSGHNLGQENHFSRIVKQHCTSHLKKFSGPYLNFVPVTSKSILQSQDKKNLNSPSQIFFLMNCKNAILLLPPRALTPTRPERIYAVIPYHHNFKTLLSFVT